MCPVCPGLPGALPVLNRRAVELATARRSRSAAGARRSIFARKNYFYPDLPKGYQISQYDRPLATAAVDSPRHGRKAVGITRVHMEEDAGKSLHDGLPDSARWTPGRLQPQRRAADRDRDRAGSAVGRRRRRSVQPRPRVARRRSASTTATWRKAACAATPTCRCGRSGDTAFGVKTELKNLNSFRHVQRAIEYEIERQRGALDGRPLVQETRLWDPPRAGRR